MNLFRLGDFKLHSGIPTRFKIDCDALTNSDWETIAYLAKDRLPRFREVVGIQSGGLPFERALLKYASEQVPLKPWYPVIIVDDVLTTGRSMEEMRLKLAKEGVFGETWKDASSISFETHSPCIGFVVFARGRLPSWIRALFTISERTEEK